LYRKTKDNVLRNELALGRCNVEKFARWGLKVSVDCLDVNVEEERERELRLRYRWKKKKIIERQVVCVRERT